MAKHGLKQADFERSLEWFSAHPETLLDIYKRLNERMAGELGNLPTPADGMAFSQDASADTTDIWQEARQVMLSSQANTHFSFQLKADTSFHAGDQLRLQFMSEWFYKEGQRSGTALLTIKYKDGTSQTGQLAIYGSGRQQTSVTIADKPIETICGFFYQNTEWSKRPRILYLSGISLLRIHSKGPPRSLAKCHCARTLPFKCPHHPSRPTNAYAIASSGPTLSTTQGRISNKPFGHALSPISIICCLCQPIDSLSASPYRAFICRAAKC